MPPPVINIELPPGPPIGHATAGARTAKKASIQKWKGENMVRIHSFLASVEQIVRRSVKMDVTKVNVIGDMGSGKSTLAGAIAHAYHSRMKQLHGIPFTVKVLGNEHLAKFDETLRDLAPTNHVIIFDDVSFMESRVGRRQMTQVKNAMTTIRHMGPRDVRILMIFNFHYSLGLDKFLRQAHFRYYTTIGESELENMERLLRRPAAMKLVCSFQRWYRAASDTGRWTTPVGRDGRHTYHYRAPWIPCLFWDGSWLRHVIGPTREWMQAKCPTCHAASTEAGQSDIAPAKFVVEARKAFGPMPFDTAVKLMLYEHGIPVYSRPVLAAKRALDSALREKAVSLEGLQIELGLVAQPQRLRSGYSKFLAAIGVASKETQLARTRPPTDDNGDKKPAPGRAQTAKPKALPAAVAAPSPPASPAPAPAPAPPAAATSNGGTLTRPPPRII